MSMHHMDPEDSAYLDGYKAAVEETNHANKLLLDTLYDLLLDAMKRIPRFAEHESFKEKVRRHLEDRRPA